MLKDFAFAGGKLLAEDGSAPAAQKKYKPYDTVTVTYADAADDFDDIRKIMESAGNGQKGYRTFYGVVMAIYIVLMLAVCVLDQLTKQWAVVVLMEKGSIPVIDGALHFTYLENRGAAFGILADQRWIFMLASCAAIVLLLVYSFL